jgi:hypothetical protein
MITWLDTNSGAVLAIVGSLTLIAITAGSLASMRMVRGTAQLIAHEQAERQGAHLAAVAAILYELQAIAYPLGLMLRNGWQMEALPGAPNAYAQLLLDFHRGLTDELGGRVAQTYSVLAVLRANMAAHVIPTDHQLDLAYNDELVPTVDALCQYSRGHGREIANRTAAIPRDEIVLYHLQRPGVLG